MKRKKRKPNQPSPFFIMIPIFTILALGTFIGVLSHYDFNRGRPAQENPAVVTVPDYLAALLINEVPFPGEPAFKSADDSKDAMRAILWTLHNRRSAPPPGYTRWKISATHSDNLVDVITAFNQMEGFFLDNNKRPAFAPRVGERITYLRRLAQRDNTPTISILLDFATTAAKQYADGKPLPFPDPFAGLKMIDDVEVTGSAYGWMTDDLQFHPGGNYVRIPDESGGGLGGNRFFTLRKTPLPPADKTEPEPAP